MSERHDDDGFQSRRSILKSAAAAGALAITPSAVGADSPDKLTKVTERGSLETSVESGSRTVTIRARGDVEYKLSVTGVLTRENAPRGTVENGTALASLSNETHKFQFSGEFTEFDLKGTAEVRVDGEPFDVEKFPHNSLTVITTSETQIDISASGRIETTADGVSQSNPRHVRGTITGQTTFRYGGELTHFEPSKGVKVRKNDEIVSTENVLPSRLPGEVRISGAGSPVSVHTSADAQIVEGSSSRAEDGVITGVAESTDIVARYDGNVEKIEHESGATVEFRPSSRRIVCKAPEDNALRFEAEASEAVVYDREAHSQIAVTVEAGQTKKIKYYGRPTDISIGKVKIELDSEAYGGAIRSAKLQRAAEVERLDAFELIDEAVDGRILHDSESLFLGAMTDEEPTESIAFQVTDLDDGDRGTVYLRRNRSTNDIKSGGYEVQWLDDDGFPEKVETNHLKTAAMTGSVGASFETNVAERETTSKDTVQSEETQKYIFESDEEAQLVDTSGVEPQLIPSIPSWVPSLPSPSDILDAFGDVVSSFASFVGTTSDVVANVISTAVENAQDTTIGDIVIDSAKIIVDTKQGLIQLVDEFQKVGAHRAVWALRVGFVDTLYSLGTSGALQELAQGNYNCGTCIAVITITVGVGLGATAAGTCTLLGIGTLGFGGVACTAFFGAVFTYGETIFFSEAEDICSWHHTPTSVNVC